MPASSTENTHQRHLVIGAILALVGFLICLALLVWHPGSGLNTAVLLWMHAHAFAATTPIARALTTVGSPKSVLALTILGCIVWSAQRRFADAAALALAVGGATAFTLGLKHLVHEARPHVFPPLAPEHGFSFPSGHTTLSFCLLTFLALWLASQPGNRLRGLWPVCLLLAGLIGWSRLDLGVHWPLDIAASAFLGGAWALAAWRVRLALLPLMGNGKA